MIARLRMPLLGLLALAACDEDPPPTERERDEAGQTEPDARTPRADAASEPLNRDAGLLIENMPNDGGARRDAAVTKLPVDAGDGTVCDGIAGLACPDGEFCNHEAGGELGCGFADGTGTCSPRPQGCTQQYDPVCGCDGQTYGNPCGAHAAGVSVASLGACAEARDTNCDPREIECKRAPPVCPGDQVPSVIDRCYGPCVAIHQCTCAEADACPDRDKYVCHMHAGHCGPYVN